jgi:hypothetical protein
MRIQCGSESETLLLVKCWWVKSHVNYRRRLFTAGQTAPANGLYLLRVEYSPEALAGATDDVTLLPVASRLDSCQSSSCGGTAAAAAVDIDDGGANERTKLTP